MPRPKTHLTLSPAEYEQLRSGHLEVRRRQLVADTLSQRRHRLTNVLEVGFGSGKLLFELGQSFPHVSFTGLETDARMLTYARSRYARANVSFQPARVGELPEREFDVVFSIDVLHHVHPLEPLVREVARSVADGGVWLVIEPNSLHPYIWLKQERMRRWGLGEDHFRPRLAERAFRAAGLAVESKRYAFFFPGWLPPLPALLVTVERALERVPILAGAVVYRLTPFLRTPCASA